MSSPGQGPARPGVVSRVKLPAPGSGMARVGDITAGSGTARGYTPEERAAAEAAMPARAKLPSVASSPAQEVSLSASLPRRVRTPRADSTPSLAASLARSLRRSSSAKDSLAASRASPGPPSSVRPSPVLEASSNASQSVMHHNPSSPSSEAGPQAHYVSEMTAESRPDPAAVLAAVRSHVQQPSATPASVASGAASVRRGGRAAAAGRARSRGQAPAAQGEAAQVSARPAPGPRSRSEPPRRGSVSQAALSKVQGGGGKPGGSRLAQLVDEVSSHLQYVRDPSDVSGWLEETAQLELFAEEIRWLLGEHASRVQQEVPDPGRRHDVSVMRGDKDLRWARQQLRYCEKEHAHLQQLLNVADPEVQQQQMAELRQVEEDIEAEHRRHKNLVAENRQRERNLTRGVVDGREVDGNARALQQIERLEAEVSVWKVKNSSLQKQLMEEESKLRRAADKKGELAEKAQKVEEQLGSEDQQARLAEQRAEEDRLQREEADLVQQASDLQEARKRMSKAHVAQSRERAKEISELEKQRAELEVTCGRIQAVEKQLKRQLRQLQQRPHQPLVDRPSPAPRLPERPGAENLLLKVPLSGRPSPQAVSSARSAAPASSARSAAPASSARSQASAASPGRGAVPVQLSARSQAAAPSPGKRQASASPARSVGLVANSSPRPLADSRIAVARSPRAGTEDVAEDAGADSACSPTGASYISNLADITAEEQAQGDHGEDATETLPPQEENSDVDQLRAVTRMALAQACQSGSLGQVLNDLAPCEDSPAEMDEHVAPAELDEHDAPAELDYAVATAATSDEVAVEAAATEIQRRLRGHIARKRASNAAAVGNFAGTDDRVEPTGVEASEEVLLEVTAETAVAHKSPSVSAPPPRQASPPPSSTAVAQQPAAGRPPAGPGDASAQRSGSRRPSAASGNAAGRPAAGSRERSRAGSADRAAAQVGKVGAPAGSQQQPSRSRSSSRGPRR